MFLIYQLMPTQTVCHYYNSPYRWSPSDLFKDIICIVFLWKIVTSDPPKSGLHQASALQDSMEALHALIPRVHQEDPRDDPQDSLSSTSATKPLEIRHTPHFLQPATSQEGLNISSILQKSNCNELHDLLKSSRCYFMFVQFWQTHDSKWQDLNNSLFVSIISVSNWAQ